VACNRPVVLIVIELDRPATGYSYLDLYLMGLIAAAEVPDFFIVRPMTRVGGGGGRSGAGRGGAGGNESANVLNHVATIKTTIGGIWETPNEALTRHYAQAKAALPSAIAEATTRARDRARNETALDWRDGRP